MIPLSVPMLAGNESRYLQECIATGWVSSVGPFVDRFEKMVADYLGASHAVAMVNGTSALHLALLVSGVRPGDGVLIPSLTFIAPVNAIGYVGAIPIFVDSEAAYAQIDSQKVREFLRQETQMKEGVCVHRKSGRVIRAIIPVDLLGHPVDLDPLLELVEEYGLKMVQDASESLGAEYRGKKVGAQSSVACLSFNGNKTVTCGGGGMLVTSDKVFADRIRYLSTQAKDHPHEYVHNEVGYNYRLTNLQAAVGCAQMEQLDRLVEKKRSIAKGYQKFFQGVSGIHLMDEAPWAKSSAWLSTLRLKVGISQKTPFEVQQSLAGKGIQVRKLWQPNHESLAHRENCIIAGGLEQAEQWYTEGLSLPSSPALTEEEQNQVCAAIMEAIR